MYSVRLGGKLSTLVLEVREIVTGTALYLCVPAPPGVFLPVLYPWRGAKALTKAQGSENLLSPFVGSRSGPMGSFYSKCAHGVATAAYGEGSFLELRVEETTILLGIIGAGLYCTAVYLTIWTAALPIRMIVSYSWDVVIASMLALIGLSRMSKRPPSKSAIAALPEAEQEKAKKQLKAAAKAASLRRTAAMALCATVALVRWYFGSVREALKL